MDKASRKNYEENRKRINHVGDKEKTGHEVGEDATKYGEFISSYFAWVSLPQQKENVEKLEKVTKTGENNTKNSKN